jgi:effector-binding domain-containing protein
VEYQITTRQVPSQAIVSIRGCRPTDDLPAFIQTAFPELYGRLQRAEVSPAGPPFVIYHEFGADGIDAEVSVPVAVPIAATTKVASRVLPAMTVAHTLHIGPYEKLSEAYRAVSTWITDHGFAVAGPIEERYLNGPGDRVASTEYQTEILMPIVPVAVAEPV